MKNPKKHPVSNLSLAAFNLSPAAFSAAFPATLAALLPAAAAGLRLCVLAAAFFAAFPAKLAADDFNTTTATVGRAADGALITPMNQIVTPAGKLIELPGMRPQALALSPDGKILVAAGQGRKLIVADPASGKILQKVSFPADKTSAQDAVSELVLEPKKQATMSMSGLVFSPDGARIYLSNASGDIKLFDVAPNGKVTALYSIGLPPANAPERKEEIPAGLALSPDGKKLYAALNLSNQLAELDAASGALLRLWETGVAPCDVVIVKNKAYVSNWGGRRPASETETAPAPATGPAGRGTTVRTDARGIASEGSVTVIDLARKPATAASPGQGEERQKKKSTHATAATSAARATHAARVAPQAQPPEKEILVGRHASALALSPNARWLVVAATADDTLYVIDTRTDQIAEKISARPNPADLFGAQPCALAFSPDGTILHAANATQNAIAFFRFDPADKESAFLGLVPTGWFPCGVVRDAKRNQLCVANMKDIDATPAPAGKGTTGSGFRTKQYLGGISLIPMPADTKELAAHTRRAFANLRHPLLAQAALPPRPDRAPAPVPERVGEPSVFKHVIYIIKENRTYDQVLGDMKTGKGDPSLCIYGEKVTPNHHKLAREFVLLDNTYCSGVLSADGHNWTGSAIATDYLERQHVSAWPRSYPSGGIKGAYDAIAYSPAGFIWDNALAHGKTVANFGEYCDVRPKRWKDPSRKGKIGFREVYRDYLDGTNAIEYGSDPKIESLRPITDTSYVGWDLSYPDVYRARHFIQALKKYEQDDNLPALVIIWLPNDHAAGTRSGFPVPEAMVADNDLAMGRIIEALSQSKYWKDTCVFAIEDDPQNGWDHISGYRTTAYVVSAHTKRGVTISTQYNQTSILRTIELILGLPPMNQMDATATPMFDCFTTTPDFTPFTPVPNRIPLDKMNPDSPKKIANAQMRKDAIASAKLPLDNPDECDEDTLNRILWRAAKGVAVAYPEWAVKRVPDDDD